MINRLSARQHDVIDDLLRGHRILAPDGRQ